MYKGEAQKDNMLKCSYIMHSMSSESNDLPSQARSGLAGALDADPS